ncbi:MAG: pilus assembly protein PilM [Planctomycetes bacterium]|nr:pilus assembly protein PilM [Planctomycetota bacterium]
MTLGIDVGASAIKVVRLSRTMKGYRVLGAARRRMPAVASAGDFKAVAARTLHEGLPEQDGRRTGVIGLSGRDVNLLAVSQPNTKPINYRTLMRYEVDQRKGSDGDLYADWCTLRSPDAYTPQYLAMVGVAKSSFVDERIAVGRLARVEIRDAVPNPLAVYTAYRNNYDVEDGVQLIVDLGATNIDMAMVRGGRLVFARNVPTGAGIFDAGIAGMSGIGAGEAEARKIQFGSLLPAQEGDPREEELRPALRTAAGQLMGVLQATIQFAKTQLQDKDLAVDKVYLAGGGARLRGLPEYLASALKVPVEILDPFRRLEGGPSADVEELRRLPSDMTVAVGLAMIACGNGRDEACLSIIPDGVRRRRDFYRGPFYLVIAGAVLLASLLALTVIAWTRRHAQESALAEFTQRTQTTSRRIEDLDKIEAEQRDVTAKVQMLSAQALAGRGVLDVMWKLRRVVPEGMTVRRIELVDLSERPHNPLPRKRCLFHAPGRGLVLGAVLKEGDGDVLTLASGEEVSLAEVGEVKTWLAPSKGVQIEGEIDENVKGGAGAALDAVKEHLGDPSRGISAEIPYQEATKDKPGWRTFRILVRLE